jgi:hypothetical protein
MNAAPRTIVGSIIVSFALAVGGLGCGGIEGSPIGTAGQNGSETGNGSSITAESGGEPTATMTSPPLDDDGLPPTDPSSSGDDAGETTSLGLDGSSTGGPPGTLEGTGTGDDGAEDSGSTSGNDLLTGTDSGSGSDTDTSSGTDTGTGSSSDSG